MELHVDEEVEIDLKFLDQNWSNQDIEFFCPQLWHYIITEGRCSDVIEKFILLRASKSVSFTHIILWNFLANLNFEKDSLSMKTLELLQALADQGKYSIENIQNTHLYPTSYSSSWTDHFIAYKGLNFEFEELRSEISLMNELNKNNQNSLLFSTPLFISDLISISEYLRTLPLDQRSEKLKYLITKLNENLPNNVYVPMK